MISIPFSGSKKHSYKRVKKIAESENYNSVYEPFGGSGVLSVNLYKDELVNRAVINDYDNFFDNYEKYLDYKDIVVDKGYKAGLKCVYHNHARGAYIHNESGDLVNVDRRSLDEKEREILQNIISENVPEEYWSYLALGNNFTHSYVMTHDEIKLSHFTMFASYLDTDKQREYLRVLNEMTVEHLDYKDFLEKYKDSFDSESLIIIDPPYPNTPQEQYKGTFDEQEARALIEYMNKLPCDYIYFHSDLEEIEKWFSDTDYSIQSITPHNWKRKDYLIFVKRNKN